MVSAPARTTSSMPVTRRPSRHLSARARLAALNARQPHGRLVAAEEVADAVAYLASPRAGSTTGIGLAVDGGMQELRLRPRS